MTIVLPGLSYVVAEDRTREPAEAQSDARRAGAEAAARALRAALAKQPQRTQIVHYGRVDSSAAADR